MTSRASMALPSLLELSAATRIGEVDAAPPDAVLRAGSVEMMDMDSIDLIDRTWRFRVAMNVTDLAASMKANGQQLPLILRRVHSRESLQIISGFRRTRAAFELGWSAVSAIVLNECTDEQAFRLSVLENEKRKTYSDIDRAHAIVKYRSMGYSVANIATEIFGLSRKQVHRLEALTTLPSFMQEAIADESLPATHAVVLKHAFARMGAKVVDLRLWVEKIAANDLSVREVQAELAKLVPAVRVQNKSQRGHEMAIDVVGRQIRLGHATVEVDSLTGQQRATLLGQLEAAVALLHKTSD